ncbi:hypothetical protein BC938DRAFT_472952 [Jimgerdemannia flammicorona]|uniref:Uncharacterized protein n=1 Tax=Jimgerdemannia flammicorona TaxID=994334 RepID=A0A433Q530_9FUNG|nr:hypothetical protein BC938DRAFT_472952 [Jimgerdemannia flammicorona]
MNPRLTVRMTSSIIFSHTRLSKELKGLLHYPEYWDRNASLWGDVVDWDIFFINKTPSCTAKSAHTALSSELDNLLENFPVGSFQHKKALALRAAIKVKFLIFSDKLLALRPATPSNIWVELRSTWMGKKSAMVSVEETTWHARIIMHDWAMRCHLKHVEMKMYWYLEFSYSFVQFSEKFRSVAMQNAAEEYSIESKNVEEDTTSNPFLASPKRKMLEDATFLEVGSLDMILSAIFIRNVFLKEGNFSLQDALPLKQAKGIEENEFENEDEENGSEGEIEDNQGEEQDEQDYKMEEEMEKVSLYHWDFSYVDS